MGFFLRAEHLSPAGPWRPSGLMTKFIVIPCVHAFVFFRSFYLHRSRYPNNYPTCLSLNQPRISRELRRELISSSPQVIVANSRYQPLVRSLRPPSTYLRTLPDWSNQCVTPDTGLTPFIDCTYERACSPIMIAIIRHVT
jgi:hypothetical protein